MTHSEVYTNFESIFSNLARSVREWFPNGKNSIRIRCTNQKDYIFSIVDKENWKLETVPSFINSLEGWI